MNRIDTADIHWQSDHQGNLVPISDAFDDVYFSHAGGIDETWHVFIAGNDLPTRWGQLRPYQQFVIAETGFGTGLNFLVACKLWQNTPRPAHTRLHFISTEKYPLMLDDLKRALSVWQDADICHFARLLLEQYPMALAGCHRLHIGDDITLDLWFGDATDSFCTIADTSAHHHAQGVNAWFLDGFTPSKNQSLWSDELFDVMHKLSCADATVATFTAAGFVRRGLIQAGFDTTKRKGFGRKREMLTARMTPQADDRPNPPKNPHPKTIAVIGAGVSGLCTAWALARRGIRVILLDKEAPLSGASGNLRALFAPKLGDITQAPDHLSTLSFLYAHRIYHKLSQTTPKLFTQTGVMDFLLPTKKSRDKLSALISPYPDELIYAIDTLDDTHIINTFVPKAGLISPHALAQNILSHPLISHQQCHASHISHRDGEAIIHAHDGTQLTFDHVVICAGFESHQLDDRLFNPRKIRGQVSWRHLDASQALPDTPIKYDGYCAKFDDIFLMGASFVRNCTDTTLCDDEHQFNLDKFAQALPMYANNLDWQASDMMGRASIRAQTPDYHPIIGQVGKHHVMYAMGSKGFCFAPLCAEILASLLCHEPLPISTNLLNKIIATRPRLRTPLVDNV